MTKYTRRIGRRRPVGPTSSAGKSRAGITFSTSFNEEHRVHHPESSVAADRRSRSLLVGGLAFTTSSPASAATCTSGVAGDVNGDGYAEVAVSEAGRRDGKGAVHVFYGRAKGLAVSASGTALDDQYLDQEEPGVPGPA